MKRSNILMYHGINKFDLVCAIICRIIVRWKKEVWKVLEDLLLTFVSTPLHVDMDIIHLVIGMLITEHCKYYNIIIIITQYYYIIFENAEYYLSSKVQYFKNFILDVLAMTEIFASSQKTSQLK